jgi:hypothetical protein
MAKVLSNESRPGGFSPENWNNLDLKWWIIAINLRYLAL